jgi:cytochrome c-type biogenesis protein CcmH/NrfG
MMSEAIKLDKSNEEARFYRALSQLDSGLNQEAIDELNVIMKSGFTN